MQVATKGKLKDFQKLYHESPERIEITDSSGNTVLHLASANGHLDIVDFILGHGGGQRN
jgi:ankyrin repeat protein